MLLLVEEQMNKKISKKYIKYENINSTNTA